MVIVDDEDPDELFDIKGVEIETEEG